MSVYIQLIPEGGTYDELKAALLRLYDDIYGYRYDPNDGSFKLRVKWVGPKMRMGIDPVTRLSFSEACRCREGGMQIKQAAMRVLRGRLGRLMRS